MLARNKLCARGCDTFFSSTAMVNGISSYVCNLQKMSFACEDCNGLVDNFSDNQNLEERTCTTNLLSENCSLQECLARNALREPC